LSASTSAVAAIARTRVILLFANAPITSVLLVKMMSEIIGSGNAMLNTT
jgi:hypothetical protein